MKKFNFGILFSLIFLTSCSSAPVTVRYKLASLHTGNGKVKIDKVTYQPEPKINKQGKKPTKFIPVENQIENTAVGKILIDSSIAEFVKKSFLLEFKFAGYKLDQGKYSLSMNVKKFLADDLGYSVDWTLIIDYVVSSQSGVEVYKNTLNVRRKTAKFNGIEDAISTIVTMAFDELINDENTMKYFSIIKN